MKYMFIFDKFASVYLCSEIVTIRYRQIFSGGCRTKMKNWSENFLRASGHFTSWRHWKPLKKPLNFPKTVNLLKKGTSKFFLLRLALFFSKHWSDDFTNLVRQKRGVKNILYPPFDNVWLSQTIIFFTDVITKLVHTMWLSVSHYLIANISKLISCYWLNNKVI